MATYLLDTNVLVAIGWPNHAHHQAARLWLASLTSDNWATCPFTETGFLRISSNPRCFPNPTTPSGAIEMLKTMTNNSSHVFWEDSISLRATEKIKPTRIRGHQQITDAYLLSLCIERNGRFATFDQGAPSLATPEQLKNHVHLLR